MWETAPREPVTFDSLMRHTYSGSMPKVTQSVCPDGEILQIDQNIYNP